MPDGGSLYGRSAGRSAGIDPIPWTSSERWIRCPACPQARPVGAARRQFSEEFKEGAVRLVLDEGKTRRDIVGINGSMVNGTPVIRPARGEAPSIPPWDSADFPRRTARISGRTASSNRRPVWPDAGLRPDQGSGRTSPRPTARRSHGQLIDVSGSMAPAERLPLIKTRAAHVRGHARARRPPGDRDLRGHERRGAAVDAGAAARPDSARDRELERRRIDQRRRRASSWRTAWRARRSSPAASTA